MASVVTPLKPPPAEPPARIWTPMDRRHLKTLRRELVLLDRAIDGMETRPAPSSPVLGHAGLWWSCAVNASTVVGSLGLVLDALGAWLLAWGPLRAFLATLLLWESAAAKNRIG